MPSQENKYNYFIQKQLINYYDNNIKCIDISPLLPVYCSENQVQKLSSVWTQNMAPIPNPVQKHTDMWNYWVCRK